MTPGEILNALLADMKTNDDKLGSIEVSFDDVVDSDGEPW